MTTSRPRPPRQSRAAATTLLLLGLAYGCGHAGSDGAPLDSQPSSPRRDTPLAFMTPDWVVDPNAPDAGASDAAPDEPTGPTDGGLCPSRWSIGAWSTCSSSCGDGMQTRAVFCVSCRDEPLAESACSALQPASSRTCQVSVYTYAYTTWSAWSTCNGTITGRTRSCSSSDGVSVACELCGGTCSETQSCAPPVGSGRAACGSTSQLSAGETNVARAYLGVMGRVPDLGGLAFWLGGLGPSTTVSAASDEILDSLAEMHGMPATYDDSRFVEDLYVNMLGKNADDDPAGRPFWLLC
ncbi:MAG: hypothetical protein IPG96_16390 [Proteobacteria bacterium]|nr:hypothetical protein [Pseudomonadota bacterium]